MSPESTGEWPLPYSKPEEVGVSSERLTRILPEMQKFIDDRKDPNFVTMIIKHGKIVFYEAQGYTDFESKKPAQKDTIYRLWSNTKPITGVATMMCLEEGLLTLDDPISKYIPAFKDPVVRVLDPPRKQEIGRPSATGLIQTIPANREVTIRDCLRNTTGFATGSNAPIQYLSEFEDVFPERKWFGGPDKSIEDIVNSLAKLPLESQPGTRFEYQVGYPVVGRILEIVTGKTLSEFYNERIFVPLEMKDSGFYLPKDKLDRFPTLYRPDSKDGEWKLAVSDNPETSEKVLGPNTHFGAGGGRGGVLSTVADYSRFAQMLLNKGELEGVRILGRKTVELMTSCHTGDDVYMAQAGPGYGFGMGVGVFKGSVPPIMRSIGTFGWSGLAGTNCIIDPTEELIWLCFTQVLRHRGMPGNTCQEDFERLVYQSLI
ncbi:serine hydrolase domain-containing protein [Chloroflexota bacterium]